MARSRSKQQTVPFHDEAQLYIGKEDLGHADTAEPNSITLSCTASNS